MHHDIVLETAGPMTEDRSRKVFALGAAIADGLRSSAAMSNIRQTADFVNGMLFCGLLLEKEGKDATPRFVDAFRTRLPKIRETIERRDFAGAEQVLARMSKHRLGVTDESPAQMLLTMGLSAEGVIREWTEEAGLSDSEQLDIVIISIALAITATTKDEALNFVFSSVISSLEEKTGVWDQIIPSDDEMFGDDHD